MTPQQANVLHQVIQGLDKVFKQLTELNDIHEQIKHKRPLSDKEEELNDGMQTMLSMAVQYAAFLTLVKEGEVNYDEQTEELIGIIVKFIEMIDDLNIEAYTESVSNESAVGSEPNIEVTSLEEVRSISASGIESVMLKISSSRFNLNIKG